MNCIFCDKENQAKSVEHIVSESLGNKEYVMEKGAVCDECNARFSKFESTALSNTIFAMERARLAVVTKKGRTSKGTIGEITIEGNKDFKKQYIIVKGLSPQNFKDFDPKTGIGKLFVKSFDKSEVSASKLLLKMGLESIFKSKFKIYQKYNFSELKDYMITKNNTDWPFLTSDFEIKPFRSIPSTYSIYNLRQNEIGLKFCEIDENTLLFKFIFGAIAMTINLLNRNLEWTKETQKNDKKCVLYPEHFQKKVLKDL